MKAKNVIQPATVDPRSVIYHLKVHILTISPMIYRRFIIDGNTHLAERHHLMQMMMGWENQHLHVFHIWGVDYGIAYSGGAYYRDAPTQIFIGNLGLRIDFPIFMLLAITGNTQFVAKRLRIPAPGTATRFVQLGEGRVLRKMSAGLMPSRLL